MISEHPLRYWQPVCWSRQLKARPRALTLCGRHIALFRTRRGIGAIDDTCPHRGYPFSRGRIDGDSLVCGYHGWKATPDGRVSCAAASDGCAFVQAYDVCERFGAVWLRRNTSTAPAPLLPRSEPPHIHLGLDIKAPIELVADNLVEMEHTGEVHWLFGYDTARLGEVEIRTRIESDSVSVFARGPQRRLPRMLRWLKQQAGSPPDDWFCDDAEFRFDPLRIIARSYWVDPSSGARRRTELLSVTYLVPLSERETRLMGFYWTELAVDSLSRVMAPGIRAVLYAELHRDRRVTELSASRALPVERMHLTRFDAPIPELRTRIAQYLDPSCLPKNPIRQHEQIQNYRL